jgi:hypothetical protein
MKGHMERIKQRKFKEQKLAILITWTFISVITIWILLFPFLAGKETVLRAAPACVSKSQFNIECIFCGMTRAFIEISNGSFSKAYSLNRGSFFVYSFFVMNSLTFIIYFLFHRKRMSTVFIDDT